ncbi:hypothetical protein LE181_12460 [Streptomyces sp. SCA3-4]|uniref:hypothetical protein n=1 Tax=Streptomyces sichuanensis TaxID=2871810 RepID=UPI001CE36048|nr:hypothetical protein [Streptomyces sichuanensis]MCA6092969.1 hypothetical protein [Streptomyces sichuanensis]
MTDQRNDDGKGGMFIGRMTGGAAASGKGARAEDRSERTGRPADGGESAPVVVPEGLRMPGEGGMAVLDMSGGAAATGENAEAVDASRQLLAVTPELLAAVGELKLDLPRFARTEQLDALDAELAGLEEDARTQGRTRSGRLTRLRELLTGGATAVGGLASAVAVVQAISSLLG